jgi:magnesium transporter
MIRCIQIENSFNSFQEIDLAKTRASLKDSKKIIWVSLESATIDEMNQVLGDTFSFHPLTIEDCLSDGYQIAKLDDFGDYLFLIANAIKNRADGFELETLELNAYLGKNYLVTCYTSVSMPPITKVLKMLKRDSRMCIHGTDFLLHSILDALVDEYLPITDRMETEIGLLEDSVLQKPDPAILERLITLKHSIMEMRRVTTPLREVVNRLARDEYPQITSANKIYFRDIFDHLMWILDISDTIRDIVSGAMDIYLNSTSLRLNEVMKALTIVSTIFLPLAFVTGLFGMNFTHIPGLASHWGFWITCLVCLCISIGMIGFFKYRRWF